MLEKRRRRWADVVYMLYKIYNRTFEMFCVSWAGELAWLLVKQGYSQSQYILVGLGLLSFWSRIRPTRTTNTNKLSSTYSQE